VPPVAFAAVFQDGVKALVEKGYKKITPFFIPYAITNMGASPSRFCITQRRPPAAHSCDLCGLLVYLPRLAEWAAHAGAAHPCGQTVMLAFLACFAAGGALLAIDQGFMGPNYSISTACATANYAFVSGEQPSCCCLILACKAYHASATSLLTC